VLRLGLEVRPMVDAGVDARAGRRCLSPRARGVEESPVSIGPPAIASSSRRGTRNEPLIATTGRPSAPPLSR
jgi:hypothetical protein